MKLPRDAADTRSTECVSTYNSCCEGAHTGNRLLATSPQAEQMSTSAIELSITESSSLLPTLRGKQSRARRRFG